VQAIALHTKCITMLGIPSSQDSEMNKFKFIVCKTGARTDVRNYLKPTHKIHLKWE